MHHTAIISFSSIVEDQKELMLARNLSCCGKTVISQSAIACCFGVVAAHSTSNRCLWSLRSLPLCCSLLLRRQTPFFASVHWKWMTAGCLWCCFWCVFTVKCQLRCPECYTLYGRNILVCSNSVSMALTPNAYHSVFSTGHWVIWQQVNIFFIQYT